MNCKFCNAELEEGVTLCPQCGKENAEDVTEEIVEEIVEEISEEISEEVSEETTAEEITEEISEEIPEEPKKKRSLWKNILLIVGGVLVAAVLIGAVLFGLDASAKATSYTVSAEKAEKARDTVVATVGDYQLTNSELQIYFCQVMSEFNSYYGSYVDLSQPLDQIFYDEANGITWQQFFLDGALENWHRYAALAQTAKDAGFTLNETQQADLAGVPAALEEMALSYGFENAADMLYHDLGPTCDVDGYMRYMEMNYYLNQYMASIYDSLTPTLEEMEAFYTENQTYLNAMGIINDGSRYVDVRHILLHPEGGTQDPQTGEITYSEDEWDACRQQAQDLLDQWKAEGATEDLFAQYAALYTQDPGSQSTGGLYANVYEGRMVPEFDAWCFDESRKPGDTDLVRTTRGYHIMYFVEGRDAWATDMENHMVSDRSTTFVENAVAENAIKVNNKKIALCLSSDVAE